MAPGLAARQCVFAATSFCPELQMQQWHAAG
jgi:hypothetical protein